MRQITDSILMIRPVAFRMNEETAVNNYFQKGTAAANDEITQKAQFEFDTFVSKLRKVGVNVIVVDDILENDTPDSIFPNNWIFFHQNGDVALYPMFAENRRRERREDVLDTLEQEGFLINTIFDYTKAEEEGVFLEGTGNLIIDRVNAKAYCALSPRANEELLIEFCEDFELFPVIFHAYQSVEEERKLIYHTNVMMCLADDFAVICLDTIDDKKERKLVISSLKEDNKEIIAINESQMHAFAGNMLQVEGAFGKKYLVMSTTAYNALTKEQVDKITAHCEILHSDISTIETLGGGSARCMMAEVFLPKKDN
ncbi:citrulline utilization hydrolase CtlX [uncultured Mesonia sp.]|uniref:citrulline utilization hydrolase CtlX n=1 Tax=uncultured Mesonia sp. TaxID=399731 RepID=UPI00374E580F